MNNFMGIGIVQETREYTKVLDKRVYIEPIQLPEESFGVCNVWYNRKSKYYRKHSSEEMILANGTCMSCWDKGLGGHPTHHQKNQKNNKDRKRKITNAL